ncbi:protein unc-93 homolog A-like isoform X2 [Dysidea avara]|uniref:protein unc-93 homolog A-like isoform X2 n=1 Tax=Dysidea avara TaxID=196820 RepID=UPI0033333DAE
MREMELEDSTAGPKIPQTSSFFYYKNLVALGTAMHLIFSSFSSIQNLQTSISGERVGLISLTVIYVFFVMSTISANMVVKAIGTKYTIVIVFMCHAVYVACNFYPSYFTLIPGSALLGLVSGPLWTSVTVYIAELATAYALHRNIPVSNVVSYFNGIFFVFFFASFITGNVISSVVYFAFQTDRDLDSNVTDVCIDSNSDSVHKPQVEEYIIIGIYQLQDIVGVCVAVFLLSKLPETTALGNLCSNKTIALFKTCLKQFGRQFFSLKSFLPVGLVCANATDMGYLYGTFTLVYITECVGVKWVGFSLMTYGVSSTIGSYSTGKLLSYIPRYVIIVLNLLLMLGLLVFLLLWDREPSYVVVFLVPILWGICDAVWNTTTTSFFGIVFESDRETGYSIQRLWQAIAFSVLFVCSLFFNTLWLLLAIFIVTMPMFLIAEWEYSDEMKNSFSKCSRYNKSRSDKILTADQ